MDLQAKTITTPVGVYKAPLNPHFTDALKKCITNVDLFKLVMENGFINPDAMNEVESRNLLSTYFKWIKDK